MKLKTLVLFFLVVVLVGYLVYNYTNPTYDAFCTIQHSNRSKVIGTTYRIPTRIYRIWVGSKLPQKFQSAWDFTAHHNPEWTQELWCDAEIDKFMRTFQNGRVYETYCALVPGAARADLTRYCILYDRGGVYLDIKSGARDLYSLIGPMDEMLVSTAAHRHFYPIQTDYHSFGEFQSWWMASSKHHPRLLELIDSIIADVSTRLNQKRYHIESHGSIFYGSRLDVIKLTGPLHLTRIILQNADGVRLVMPHGNNIMVYDVTGTHRPGQSYSSGLLLRAESHGQ